MIFFFSARVFFLERGGAPPPQKGKDTNFKKELVLGNKKTWGARTPRRSHFAYGEHPGRPGIPERAFFCLANKTLHRDRSPFGGERPRQFFAQPGAGGPGGGTSHGVSRGRFSWPAGVLEGADKASTTGRLRGPPSNRFSAREGIGGWEKGEGDGGDKGEGNPGAPGRRRFAEGGSFFSLFGSRRNFFSHGLGFFKRF